MMNTAPIPCGFFDFAASLLIPQPYKYRFLSTEATKAVSRNAIVGNLNLFTGGGAEEYETKHLQNAEVLRDIHSNTATTGRLISEYFQPGTQLLEIGCGTGFWSGHLLAKVEHATFNDLSSDMVNEHRKRRTPQELSRIERYHCGPLESLCDEMSGKHLTFDHIVAISTLHHLEHRDQQIPRLWELLRPGGQFLFIEPCHNLKRQFRILYQLLFKYRAPYIPATHDFLTRSEVLGWLRSPALHDAEILALATTQFPLLGRLSRWSRGYRFLDRLLQHLWLLRGQGNTLFSVLRKRPS